MKTLNAYIIEAQETTEKLSGQIVSLEGIDEELSSKIQNLNDAPIHECCGCCDCECDPCCGDECCGKSLGGTTVHSSVFTSEWQVVDRLRYNPIVSDMYSIYNQFGNKTFIDDTDDKVKEPLYFGVSCGLIKLPNNENDKTILPLNKNKKFYDFVKDLCKSFGLDYPVIIWATENEPQLFFIKNGGKNEIGGSIKDSLTEVAKILGKLDDKEEITWSQVLNVSIDSIDDIYYYLVTCKVDIAKFTK